MGGLGSGEKNGTWKKLCLVIRDSKIIQIHFIHTETMGEHKVKCVPFVMAGLLHILGQTKRIKTLIKSEVNEEEEGQQTCILKSPRMRTLLCCNMMTDIRSENS